MALVVIIVLASIRSLISFATVLSHSYVLATFFRTPSLRTSARNWLLFNVSLSDILGSWMYASTMSTTVKYYGTCVNGLAVLMFISFNVCTLTLLGTTLNQWLHITRPFLFMKINEVKMAIRYIILIWTLSICIGIAPLYELIISGNEFIEIENSTATNSSCMTRHDISFRFMVIFTIVLLIPTMVAIFTMQFSILRIVKKHLVQIQQTTIFDANPKQNNSDFNQTDQENQSNNNTKCRAIIDKNIKTARVLWMYLLLICFGMIPGFILMCVLCFCDDCHNRPTDIAITISVIMASITSVMSPWTLALRLPDFEEAFKELRSSTRWWGIFCCCCCIPCLKRK